MSVLAQVPNDSDYGDQWYAPLVGAEEAWDVTAGADDVVVAVIDTGIDLDHVDLKGRLWSNSVEVAGNGIDDDENGYIDDVSGWDFVDSDNDPTAEESNVDVQFDGTSHGTFIAGIIAATANNSQGYAGLTWKGKIMPLRILDQEGSGTDEAAARSIRYAVKNGADVINLSFAGPNTRRQLSQAIKEAYEAGVVVVAALGNEGIDVDFMPVYPACSRSVTDDWVIGVTASDERDRQTDFTNYGKSCADIAAPGVNINSLGFYDPTSGYDQAYIGPWDGTSFAAPIVSAGAALLLSQYPDLTPTQIETILKLSADPVISFTFLGDMGVGRINIARALQIAPSFIESNPAAPTPGGATSEANPNQAKDQSLSSSFIAYGAAPGKEPWVKILRADGTPYAEFLAYSTNFTGGVEVSLADFDYDGIPEIITGTGESGGPHVRIFKAYGSLIAEWFAYAPASDKGVRVGVGDYDDDGVKDVFTAVGGGVSDQVIAWSQTGEELGRFSVAGLDDTSTWNLAIGDVDKDYSYEAVITNRSGAPTVAVYNVDGSALASFSAFDSGVTSGLNVSTLDLNGDYIQEIAVAPNAPSGSHVRIFNRTGALINEFFAFNAALGVGARLAGGDLDVDGEGELAVIAQGADSYLEAYYDNGRQILSLPELIIPAGSTLAVW